jgi:Tol biopolymer transport system component
MLLACPHWSPDGSALLFEAVGLSATGQASVTAEWVAADGTGRRTVATMARYPSFSPDGRRVVYTRALPTGDALWEQPLDGGEGRQILEETLFLVIAYPRYSPDGAQIAFAGVADRVPGYQPTGMPGSGAPGPSTTGPDTTLPAPARTAPKLLGVSRGVAPFSARTVLAHGFPAEPWIVSQAGTDPRPLAQLPIDDAAIAWSPDGQSVASSGATGLFVIGTTDGSVRKVTEHGSFGAIDWR